MAIQIGIDIAQDGSWLQKQDNAAHVNFTELETVIKGLNMLFFRI